MMEKHLTASTFTMQRPWTGIWFMHDIGDLWVENNAQMGIGMSLRGVIWRSCKHWKNVCAFGDSRILFLFVLLHEYIP